MLTYKVSIYCLLALHGRTACDSGTVVSIIHTKEVIYHNYTTSFIIRFYGMSTLTCIVLLFMSLGTFVLIIITQQYKYD